MRDENGVRLTTKGMRRREEGEEGEEEEEEWRNGIGRHGREKLRGGRKELEYLEGWSWGRGRN